MSRLAHSKLWILNLFSLPLSLPPSLLFILLLDRPWLRARSPVGMGLCSAPTGTCSSF